MTGRQFIELLSAVNCRMKVAFTGQGMHQTGQEITEINKGESRSLVHRDEQRHHLSRALPADISHSTAALTLRACQTLLFSG